MSSYKDKCEVSEDKYKDKKNGRFSRSDKLDRGQKGKGKTASRGIYKDAEVEDAERGNFSTQVKSLALKAIRQFSIFVIDLRLN